MSEEPEQAEPPSAMANPTHETHIYGPVSAPIHTGTGNIHINNPPASGTLKDRLAELFHWTEAPAHMRSSWAGIIIWSLSTVTDRLTPQHWLIFLVSIML